MLIHAIRVPRNAASRTSSVFICKLSLGQQSLWLHKHRRKLGKSIYPILSLLKALQPWKACCYNIVPKSRICCNDVNKIWILRFRIFWPNPPFFSYSYPAAPDVLLVMMIHAATCHCHHHCHQHCHQLWSFLLQSFLSFLTLWLTLDVFVTLSGVNWGKFLVF